MGIHSKQRRTRRRGRGPCTSSKVPTASTPVGICFPSSREWEPPSRPASSTASRHRRPQLDNGPRRWKEKSPIQVVPPFPSSKKKGIVKGREPSPGPPPALEVLQCGIVIGRNPLLILGRLAHSSCPHPLIELPSAGAWAKGKGGRRSRGCWSLDPTWIPFPDVVRNFSPPQRVLYASLSFLAGFAVVAPFADVASCRSFCWR